MRRPGKLVTARVRAAPRSRARKAEGEPTEAQGGKHRCWACLSAFSGTNVLLSRGEVRRGVAPASRRGLRPGPRKAPWPHRPQTLGVG